MWEVSQSLVQIIYTWSEDVDMSSPALLLNEIYTPKEREMNKFPAGANGICASTGQLLLIFYP